MRPRHTHAHTDTHTHKHTNAALYISLTRHSESPFHPICFETTPLTNPSPGWCVCVCVCVCLFVCMCEAKKSMSWQLLVVNPLFISLSVAPQALPHFCLTSVFPQESLCPSCSFFLLGFTACDVWISARLWD